MSTTLDIFNLMVYSISVNIIIPTVDQSICHRPTLIGIYLKKGALDQFNQGVIFIIGLTLNGKNSSGVVEL